MSAMLITGILSFKPMNTHITTVNTILLSVDSLCVHIYCCESKNAMGPDELIEPILNTSPDKKRNYQKAVQSWNSTPRSSREDGLPKSQSKTSNSSSYFIIHAHLLFHLYSLSCPNSSSSSPVICFPNIMRQTDNSYLLDYQHESRILGFFF